MRNANLIRRRRTPLVGWYQRILNNSGLQALYDPSDLTSLYQSRTGGSTGAVDSVVGIMLDKSQMGGKTAAAFIAGQSSPSTSVWTLLGAGASTVTESPSGTINITGDGTNSAQADKSFTTVVDRWYVVSFDVAQNAVTHRVGTSQGGTQIVASTSQTVGTSTVVFKATTTTTWMRFNRAAAGLSVTSGISLKEIPGYHALAPSDAARPILRSASSKNYLDADGTDDWMNVFPTLNLGEQWWHVGGWQADANSDWYFTTSNDGKGGLLRHSSLMRWYDNTSTLVSLNTAGSPENAHVATIEQTATGSLSGRYNGAASVGAITPFDDSGGTQGLALFTGVNSAYSGGLDGRFYGGAFGTGTLSSSDRSILERYVAGLTGVTL